MTLDTSVNKDLYDVKYYEQLAFYGDNQLEN